MPVPPEFLLIVLLLAVAVVYGYFYLKRAQARTSAKTAMAARAEREPEPVVFTAPSRLQTPPASTASESTAGSPESKPGESST
jgi:hypothetical protein